MTVQHANRVSKLRRLGWQRCLGEIHTMLNVELRNTISRVLERDTIYADFSVMCLLLKF